MAQPYNPSPHQIEGYRLLCGPATHVLLRGGARSGKTVQIIRFLVNQPRHKPPRKQCYFTEQQVYDTMIKHEGRRSKVAKELDCHVQRAPRWLQADQVDATLSARISPPTAGRLQGPVDRCRPPSAREGVTPRVTWALRPRARACRQWMNRCRQGRDCQRKCARRAAPHAALFSGTKTIGPNAIRR
jgi:hypothetical protein